MTVDPTTQPKLDSPQAPDPESRIPTPPPPTVVIEPTRGLASLQLRAPWEYLAQAHAALKGGGFFGAILPTTNQVSHLLNDLRQSGFAGLEVEELILRPYKAVPARLRPMDRIIAHTGYLVFARKVLDADGEDWLTTKRGRSRAAERGDQDDYW